MSDCDINVGESFIDDDGDEVSVRKVNRTKGTVVLVGENGSYEMSLEDLCDALESGEFEELVDSEGDEVA